MATTLKVSDYFIRPATNKGKHPATMGTSLSVNMYREVNQDIQYLASVPGTKFWKRFSTSSKCRGAYVSTIGLNSSNQEENAFVVFGTRVYRIDYNENVEYIGSVGGGTSRVSIAETGGLRPFLLIADGHSLWAYNLLEGGTLQQISLPQRVTGDGGQIQPSHVAVVAGSVCVNDVGSGFVYYSVPYPLNSEKREVFQMQMVGGKMQPVYDPDNKYKVLTTEEDAFEYMFYDNYGAQQYFNAEVSSDNIKAIAAIGGNLYLMGYKTIEIWQRGSAEYETWQRVSYSVNASNGLAVPYSIAVCGATLFYLGSGESYAKGVMTVEGTSYKKISEDWLDEKLLGETSDSTFAFAYAQGNHHFYVLQLRTLGETWVYDTFTNEWTQRTSRNKQTGVETRWRVSQMLWFRNRFLAFCDDGCGYLHSDDYWYEDYDFGATKIPMIRHRQGAIIVDDERQFIFHELAIECNVGTVPDYADDPQLLLQVSKDGGMTYGHVRSASLGKTGKYNHRVRFHNLGINRLCVLRVTCSSPCALELTNCSERVSATNGVI